MNRRRLLAWTGLACLGLGSFALAQGCGGATAPVVVGDDASVADGASSLDDAGEGTDAGATDDAATSVFDGLAPDPGVVQCGSVPCASADHYCCIDGSDGGSTCRPETVSSCSGERKACDEAADCKGSTPLCCAPPSAAAPPRYYDSTFCAPLCVTYQVCKSSAECVNGKPCVSQTCRGKTVQTCGALPNGACDS